MGTRVLLGIWLFLKLLQLIQHIQRLAPSDMPPTDDRC